MDGPFFVLKARIGKTRRPARSKLSAMNPEFLRAVWERDASFDGLGVYGVQSTRIFCRPSCPSKRPKSENIRLFGSVEAARNAGFRACLRCHPERFEQEIAQLEPNRTFEQATRLSGREWQENERMTRLKTELRSGKSVNQAQNEAGFGSARALYERAPARLGMTPASYGKGGLGAQIRFAMAPCELGFVLVARTEVGVCSVMLGDDEITLQTRLKSEFFAARITRDDTALRAEIETVVASLRGQMPSPILPLDVRATAFEARVWLELTRLKRGETVSYGELATRMKMPKSTRAVASACARNPVALVHPCHRVVGKGGELSGYRWGLERKRKLLQLESGD